MSELLAVEWARICDDCERRGFERLPHPDQVFFCVWMLLCEVDNGGFCQYILNSTGDHAMEAVSAMRELGASGLAGVCERFFALLPGGRPASDMHRRQKQLDQAVGRMGEDGFEDACSALEAEFYAGKRDLCRQLGAYVETYKGN